MSNVVEMTKRHDRLIERLEAVEWHGSRALDGELFNTFPPETAVKRYAFYAAKDPHCGAAKALGRYHDGWVVAKGPDDGYPEKLPRYTSSIDDAMDLLKRVLPDWGYQLGQFGRDINTGLITRPRAQLAQPITTCYGPGVGVRSEVTANTLPIALCIAIARAADEARIQKAPSDA